MRNASETLATTTSETKSSDTVSDRTNRGLIRKGFAIGLVVVVLVGIIVGCSMYVGVLIGKTELLSPVVRRQMCGNADMRSFEHILTRSASKDQLCFECETAMRTFRQHGFEFVYNELRKLCHSGMSPYDEPGCLDMLEMYKEEVRYILYQLQVPDSEACKLVLGCGLYNNTVYNWEFDIPTEPYRPRTVQTGSAFESAPFAVFHLTDTHVSFEYNVGADFSCGEELCCTNRQINQSTKMSEKGAGPYGEIRRSVNFASCDLPMRTLRSSLRSAANLNFEVVYMTGDFIPHTTFNYSFDRVIREITEQTEAISNALPEKKIFVAIGNHDDYPAFLFPVQKMQAGKYSVDKLYNALWNIWGGKWIPSEGKRTFLRGGYYTALVRKGVRLFSLNTIYCYTLNWWLAVDPRDPEDQLGWLNENLQKAADAGEHVHIIGHIPPGTTDCYKEWATAYQKVISRHRNIIKGQFFGHMHWDQFTVDWSIENDTTKAPVPTGVQITSPAATTYMTGYPSYRILHFNNSGILTDMDTYLLNITKLNNDFLARTDGFDRKSLEKAVDELDRSDTSHQYWTRIYSTRQTYGLKDLSARSFADLIERFAKNNSLLEVYYRALYQHHEEPYEVACEDGSCTTGYYYRTGLQHFVTCEMHSYGSNQYIDCVQTNGILSAGIRPSAFNAFALLVFGCLATSVGSSFLL